VVSVKTSSESPHHRWGYLCMRGNGNGSAAKSIAEKHSYPLHGTEGGERLLHVDLIEVAFRSSLSFVHPQGTVGIMIS